MSHYRDLESVLCAVAEGVRPPERLTIVEAAERHRRINNPAVWVGPWDRNLTPYMNEVQDTLLSLEHTGCVFVGPAQSGKCLAAGTPVMMADGTTRSVESIRVGEAVMGPDLRPRTVTTLAQGRERLYRVTQQIGMSYVVNESHILSFRQEDGTVINPPVADLIAPDAHEALPSLYGWAVPKATHGDPTVRLTDVHISRAGVGSYYGFTLAGPDRLFLLGDGTVTHNTDVILNWINYSGICDPMDTMVIHPTQVAARDFSRRRVDRLHRESAELKTRLVPKRESDSVYYKQYRSGMILNQSWPTISELSGRPIGRLWLTDVDRMTDDVDGEGAPFDLARKRATTFGRYGMTVAESSPGRNVTNSKWLPQMPHEAPPTTGILSLYNRGDRRLWFWRCPHCKGRFEPTFDLLDYPNSADPMEAAEAVVLPCPKCGAIIRHEEKAALNRDGVWLKAGQRFDANGDVVGKAIRSDIASFWLKGVAAAFADWRTLVLNYLQAEEEYQRTGDQGALQTTINTDQGMPFTPRGMEAERLPEVLKARAVDLGEKTVPAGARFLLATVDVQKNRFEVQVQGVGVGGDLFIVDRFAIRKSERVDDDGDPWPVSPAAYPEDWELLKERVLDASYPLDDGSGRRMMIRMTTCDSGGRAGVTTRAYEFYRSLKERGVHQRFILLKGASSKTAPRQRIEYPDSDRKDRHAGARGEIPVMMINGNLLKDQLNAMLDREEPYGGMIHFPDWLPDAFYMELTAEIRTEKGWENPRKLRNEAWDLLVYSLALCRSRFVQLERIDWEDPPGWAAEWDDNDLVFGPQDNKRFEEQPTVDYDFSKYAEALA